MEVHCSTALQAQNPSAPHVRGPPCLTQQTRGLLDELRLAGFMNDAPKLITSAAITTQAALRGHLCRHRLQGLRAAAVKIQACWRAWFCRRNFLLMKTIAAPVQPGFKGRLSHQDWLQLQLDMKEFLNFRAEVTLFRQQRPQRLRKYNAIDRIEAAWIGYKARQRFQLMKTAALKLQAAFRCHLQRQRFVCLKAAALKIQSAVRGHRLRQQFLTFRAAAIVVQRLYKLRLCRQKLRRSATAAVTALQASDS